MLKSVKVDPQPFAEAIRKRENASSKFADRLGYGNLLLAADRSSDAEALFRQLYQSASTQQDLAAATEGLAGSLRAEDGNLARANAWLLSLQQAK